MGYWQRKSKWILEMKKEERREHKKDSNPYRFSRGSKGGGLNGYFNREEALVGAIGDPHYLCFEMISDHESLLKEQGLYKFVSNLMEHSWRGHKWRKQFVEKLEDLELSDLSTESDDEHHGDHDLSDLDDLEPSSFEFGHEAEEDFFSSSLCTTPEARADPVRWESSRRIIDGAESKKDEEEHYDMDYGITLSPSPNPKNRRKRVLYGGRINAMKSLQSRHSRYQSLPTFDAESRSAPIPRNGTMTSPRRIWQFISNSSVSFVSIPENEPLNGSLMRE